MNSSESCTVAIPEGMYVFKTNYLEPQRSQSTEGRWERTRSFLFSNLTTSFWSGGKIQAICINCQCLPLLCGLVWELFYGRGDCDSWLGHYLHNFLNFLNLRSSIVRDQEQRKVRTCIAYNLTNPNAVLEGAGWVGGNYTQTIQNKSFWMLPNTAFSLLCWMFCFLVLCCLGFFRLGRRVGLNSSMSLMLNSNSFCEMPHSSRSNNLQKEE